MNFSESIGNRVEFQNVYLPTVAAYHDIVFRAPDKAERFDGPNLAKNLCGHYGQNFSRLIIWAEQLQDFAPAYHHLLGLWGREVA